MSSLCLSLVCVGSQGLEVKWSLSHSTAKSFHILYSFSAETTLDILLNELMMHLYCALLCIVVHPKRFKSNQIKSNHFYCHITTAQVPWWVKFLWACSRQCRKTTDNLHMDRQCKKTTDNLHMDRQCKKTTTAIYIWTDSAKKQQQFTYGQYILQTVQKTMCKIHIHILTTHSVL